MKNKMTLLILGSIIIIILGLIAYMRFSCTGLWERQISKIPSNLLSTDGPSDYTKCAYIGFSGMISRWNEKTNSKAAITKADLDQIRSASIKYWEQSSNEFKDAFITGIKNGAYLIGDGALKEGKFVGDVVNLNDWPTGKSLPLDGPALIAGNQISIGSWKLERDSNNEFILILYGDHASATKAGAKSIYNFGLRLKRNGDVWSVKNDFYESQQISAN